MAKKINLGIKVPVFITKEKFTTDDGEIIKYYSITLKLGDEKFRLVSKKDDKRALNLLLKELFANPDVEKVPDEENEVEIEKDSDEEEDDLPY